MRDGVRKYGVWKFLNGKKIWARIETLKETMISRNRSFAAPGFW